MGICHAPACGTRQRIGLIVILPARIRGGNILLRPLRPCDCRRFITLDGDAARGLPARHIPVEYSWPVLWWRLKKILDISYCIVVNGSACGLIGLYDMIPGDSAYVALTVFDPAGRRKGTGTAVLRLLLDEVVGRGVALCFMAEVGSGHGDTVRFWMNSGFEPLTAETGAGGVLRREMARK